MKPKTARRFLNRNQHKMLRFLGSGSPSFWRRVDKCRDVLNLDSYKRLSPLERIGRMFFGSGL